MDVAKPHTKWRLLRRIRCLIYAEVGICACPAHALSTQWRIREVTRPWALPIKPTRTRDLTLRISAWSTSPRTITQHIRIEEELRRETQRLKRRWHKWRTMETIRALSRPR